MSCSSGISTPLSTAQFAAHPRGEIYGLAHTPARFAARQLRAHTPIPNLFLTGVDICTAGVGGALLGGIMTASAITRKNLIGALLKSDAPLSTSSTSPAHPSARLR